MLQVPSLCRRRQPVNLSSRRFGHEIDSRAARLPPSISSMKTSSGTSTRLLNENFMLGSWVWMDAGDWRSEAEHIKPRLCFVILLINNGLAQELEDHSVELRRILEVDQVR